MRMLFLTATLLLLTGCGLSCDPTTASGLVIDSCARYMPEDCIRESVSGGRQPETINGVVPQAYYFCNCMSYQGEVLSYAAPSEKMTEALQRRNLLPNETASTEEQEGTAQREKQDSVPSWPEGPIPSPYGPITPVDPPESPEQGDSGSLALP